MRRSVVGALVVVAIWLGWGPVGGTARGLVARPAPVSSSPLVVSADGATLVVVNPDSCTISLVAIADSKVVAETRVGVEPVAVAIDEAAGRVWVADRGSDELTVVDLDSGGVVATIAVGHRPAGVVVAPDGSAVYVAEQGSGQVRVVDPTSFATLATVAAGERPTGLALDADSRRLYVTHLLGNTITVLDVADAYAAAEIALWADSNLVRSLVIAPDGALAYVPHSRANTQNHALTFDTTVFPLVSLVDLVAGEQLVGQQLSLDVLDPPGVGLPTAAALSPDGATLYVVNAASNDVSVVDLTSRALVAHVEVGASPQGVAVSPDGSTVYVANLLDGTVSVVDATSAAVAATITVSEIPLPPALLLGKQLFYSSDDPRLARAQWIACTTCHVDGRHDGRTWFFGFAGPRNTTSLEGMVETYPLRWSAEWDEAADSEFAITREQFGSGLLGGAMHDPLGEPNAGRSYELDCLGAFLDSLEAPPYTAGGDLDPAAVARGEALFDDSVVDCATCHRPPYYNDFSRHDVGTANGVGERLGPEVDTPALRNLDGSAPYLHDGSAATLLEVLTSANPNDEHGVTSHLAESELDDLVAYLRSLPGEASAGVVGRRSLVGAASLGQETNRERLSGSATRTPGARLGPEQRLGGRVIDAATGEPVAGALVTVRATALQTTSGSDGSFAIWAEPGEDELELAAWARGYYIASETVEPPASAVELELRHLHTADNPDYEWLDPTPDASSGSACGNCHPAILPQWRANAHGRAISNPRFFSFYNGTDVDGVESVSPGYRLDFPGTAGSCATCHAPGAALDDPFSTDPTVVRGETTAGIHCDFCHKLGGVYLRPISGAAYRNMPGVFSLRALRPPAGDQVFFGPFPDVHDPDTYLPEMADSAFCAPCHEHSFWGTPIYTSYSEWLASPYADPDSGQTCQECHMPPNGDTHFALPEQGGLEHPPETIPSHLQLGVSDRALMRGAARLEIEAERVGGALEVTVRVSNVGAGHDLPTDHPGRHLILTVAAEDGAGNDLAPLEGPLVPSWGGSYAGLAGTGYAKILEDVASAESPVVSYWKQALIVADTRLPALATDTTRYRFADSAVATVRARVVFRRLFEPIAERYGWDLGEIVLAEASVSVGGG